MGGLSEKLGGWVWAKKMCPLPPPGATQQLCDNVLKKLKRQPWPGKMASLMNCIIVMDCPGPGTGPPGDEATEYPWRPTLTVGFPGGVERFHDSFKRPGCCPLPCPAVPQHHRPDDRGHLHARHAPLSPGGPGVAPPAARRPRAEQVSPPHLRVLPRPEAGGQQGGAASLMFS